MSRLQENETPWEILSILDNRPYRLFTFIQWSRFRAKHLLKFPAQYD